MKMANTLKLSCSTVAKTIQRFKKAGSTRNKSQVGRPKKLSTRDERHIQMLSLKDRHRSAVSITAEIEEVCVCVCGGVSLLVLRPYAALYIKLVCMAVPQEEASSEDYTQESLQSVCWRHANKAHGLMEPCPMVLWDED